MRVKLGVLVGRPCGAPLEESIVISEEDKCRLIEQFRWGVPERRIAENFNIDRNTVIRWLHRWGIKHSPFIARQERLQKANVAAVEYGKELAIGIDREKLITLIKADLTIPQIHQSFAEEYSYMQIYGTILTDRELNPLYRKHGQKKVKKQK